jgi:aerobic carbon-monoxide dehydrogenase large subunit
LNPYRFIGKSLPRSEDTRLLRGLGRYTSDLASGGHCHLYVIRSPHAAARIRRIDTGAAGACPGVRLVLTGEDAEIAGLGTFSSRVKRQAPDGSPNFEPPYRVLTRERVRFVGDAVAAVFADSADLAKDAADRLDIDWEPLPSVTSTAHAADAGAPQVWPQAPNNICFSYEVGNRARTAEALAHATHRVSLSYPINRILAAPMETRSAYASYDAGRDSYELYAGLQNPHYIREELAERVLRIDGNRLRVVSPDVGGAFGLKEAPFPEMVLALVGARRIGRPVLWVCERSESFIADHHARDNYATVTLGLDGEGNFLALMLESIGNIGAYISYNGLHSPTNNLGGLSCLYRTPHIHAQVTGVFTNTPPTAPYRGAGRPEATFAIERAIDLAAQRFGFDRVELRRRNLIAAAQMPYDTGFVFSYDSGEFEKNMDDALALGDWAGFPERRKAAAARGKLAGISVTNAIEIAAGPVTGPFAESAEVSFDSTGAATVTLGTHSQGQGHEISFAQIVADMLGLAPADIQVRYGDTAQLAHGTGTFGSRSVVAASVSLARVTERIIERGKRIAAVHFEAARADIEFEAGHFSVAGTDKRVSLRQVAKLAHTLRHPDLGGEYGLSEKTMAAPATPTFPNGCHVCEVEIDPDTGECRITRYCVVDDVGRVIHPMLVKGQIHGGVAQGVGQVLLENICFDEHGQLLTGSFMDYALPRASDLPDIECHSNEVLTRGNPLGVKGAGEAGTVGALAAVVNAVVDALAPLGVEHVDMPVSAESLWRTIRAACARQES